jgi:threonine/homoserine/homoserine lactone efflux protein
MPNTAEKLDQASARLEGAAKALAGFNTGNQSHISINAGGLAVWIATTACLIMLSVVVIGALWMSREVTRADQEMIELREQVKTTQTYLNSIFQAVPSLKPKPEDKEKDDARR